MPICVYLSYVYALAKKSFEDTYYEKSSNLVMTSVAPFTIYIVTNNLRMILKRKQFANLPLIATDFDSNIHCLGVGPQL